MERKVKVLLVDDQEDNLFALEAILSTLQQTLVKARSGEEAMKALLRDDFAVVLLDVVMPGMDGFETATHIKRLDQTKSVPIIFLTGVGGGEDFALRGYAAGAVDYMTKPFDPWVLRAKVQIFIELYRKNRTLQEQTVLLQRLLAEAAAVERVERDLNRLGQRLDTMERSLRGLTAAEGGDAVAAYGELADQVAHLRTAVEALHER
ncbi:MAG: response regulator [Streptomycetaceae bacterium]|nr:response regulator [Streptomycetaceae bacterium]